MAMRIHLLRRWPRQCLRLRYSTPRTPRGRETPHQPPPPPPPHTHTHRVSPSVSLSPLSPLPLPSIPTPFSPIVFPPLILPLSPYPFPYSASLSPSSPSYLPPLPLQPWESPAPKPHPPPKLCPLFVYRPAVLFCAPPPPLVPGPRYPTTPQTKPPGSGDRCCRSERTDGTSSTTSRPSSRYGTFSPPPSQPEFLCCLQSCFEVMSPGLMDAVGSGGRGEGKEGKGKGIRGGGGGHFGFDPLASLCLNPSLPYVPSAPLQTRPPPPPPPPHTHTRPFLSHRCRCPAAASSESRSSRP